MTWLIINQNEVVTRQIVEHTIEIICLEITTTRRDHSSLLLVHFEQQKTTAILPDWFGDVKEALTQVNWGDVPVSSMYIQVDVLALVLLQHNVVQDDKIPVCRIQALNVEFVHAVVELCCRLE